MTDDVYDRARLQAELKHVQLRKAARNFIPARSLAAFHGPKTQGRVVPAPPTQTCPACGGGHWHPAGCEQCVACELRRVRR